MRDQTDYKPQRNHLYIYKLARYPLTLSIDPEYLFMRVEETLINCLGPCYCLYRWPFTCVVSLSNFIPQPNRASIGNWSWKMRSQEGASQTADPSRKRRGRRAQSRCLSSWARVFFWGGSRYSAGGCINCGVIYLDQRPWVSTDLFSLLV